MIANSEDLKSQTNLRDIVRVLWGTPQQSRQQYDVYASRWRDDGGQAINGDVYTFLQYELNCTLLTMRMRNFQNGVYYAVTSRCCATLKGKRSCLVSPPLDRPFYPAHIPNHKKR